MTASGFPVDPPRDLASELLASLQAATQERITRVRTGVMHDHQGWWVVQQVGTEQRFYGLADGDPFPNEEQADMAAQAAARATRKLLAEAGTVFDA